MHGKWEKGAFVQNVANPAYAMKGEVTTFYEDGNVTIENPRPVSNGRAVSQQVKSC
jgi:hypothetical protein